MGAQFDLERKQQSSTPQEEEHSTASNTRSRPSADVPAYLRGARIQLESASQTVMGVKMPITRSLLDATTHAEPDLPRAYRGDYEYSEIKGEPFVLGPDDVDAIDPNDVRQGFLGDCYLFAAMMAVARANPQMIRDAVKDNRDGTYDVTLHVFEHFWSRARIAKTIRVRSTFPTVKGGDRGTPVYGGIGDLDSKGPELWAMLIEKAWATEKGGYDEIGGGNAGDAIGLLTGAAVTTHNTGAEDERTIATTLQSALMNNQPITAGTLKKIPADDYVQVILEGVVEDHAYAVRSVDLEAMTISLENPWHKTWEAADFGSDHEQVRKQKTGALREPRALPLAVFKRVFDRYYVGAKG